MKSKFTYNVSIFTNSPLRELEYYFDDYEQAYNWLNKNKLLKYDEKEGAYHQLMNSGYYGIELSLAKFERFKISKCE